ncbi:hypothetical protein OE88DRAFT_657036 [Heliocybe sulcata]|uniref:Uncharacterized protein n=1 Tax=Heliocybe sulcata TaxID=5364 RepID=A0A5C3ND37_9AGAM|nr:hypothetical protein OE88DRAFT_657036 [Heliocybe sulcata]
MLILPTALDIVSPSWQNTCAWVVTTFVSTVCFEDAQAMSQGLPRGFPYQGTLSATRIEHEVWPEPSIGARILLHHLIIFRLADGMRHSSNAIIRARPKGNTRPSVLELRLRTQIPCLSSLLPRRPPLSTYCLVRSLIYSQLLNMLQVWSISFPDVSRQRQTLSTITTPSHLYVNIKPITSMSI